MPSTTTTTMITTLMASNDIPTPSMCYNESVPVAAVVNGEATLLPSPALWSFFVLGEKNDRMLEVYSDMGIVRIKTLTAPNNLSLIHI